MAGANAESKIRQGITTEVVGNCGMSASPIYGAAVAVAEASMTDYGFKVT